MDPGLHVKPPSRLTALDTQLQGEMRMFSKFRKYMVLAVVGVARWRSLVRPPGRHGAAGRAATSPVSPVRVASSCCNTARKTPELTRLGEPRRRDARRQASRGRTPSRRTSGRSSVTAGSTGGLNITALCTASRALDRYCARSRRHRAARSANISCLISASASSSVNVTGSASRGRYEGICSSTGLCSDRQPLSEAGSETARGLRGMPDRCRTTRVRRSADGSGLPRQVRHQGPADDHPRSGWCLSMM